LDLRKKFEAREWQKNELFSEYCHHKLILRNRMPIAKEKILRNQTWMHLFSSVQEIMQAFSKIILKQEQQANKEAVSKNINRRTWNGLSAVHNKETDAQNVRANRGTLKCYECNETGLLRMLVEEKNRESKIN